MCFFGNNTPAPPPVAPITPLPSPVDPTKSTQQATDARNDQAKKAQVAQGLASTIATSPLGVTSKADVQKPGLYS